MIYVQHGHLPGARAAPVYVYTIHEPYVQRVHL